MGFFVTVTFDLNYADPQIYRKIKRDLQKIDLTKLVHGKSKRPNKLPANTFVTEFDVDEFNKSKDVAAFISKKIKLFFKKHNVSGKYFISAGRKWAWKIGCVKS